jgi:hypothetical protein
MRQETRNWARASGLLIGFGAGHNRARITRGNGRTMQVIHPPA